MGPTMLYRIARAYLFAHDAEWAHEFTIHRFRELKNSPLLGLVRQRLPEKPVNAFGLTFKNPLGLAAGLDKNGECIPVWDALGFGFIEVGTVTPRPQPGNDKPRLFRLREAQAIINRMGFNNEGVDYLVEQVKAANYKGVLGINIGKNLTTPVEQGRDDYLTCLDKVYDHASYVAVNISSPNTPGLRKLQYGEALDDLLGALMARRGELAAQKGKTVPLLVKIAPDLEPAEIEQIADTFRRHAIDGVIATNTTLSRDSVAGLAHASEAGGLSGRPLASRSTAVVAAMRQALGDLPIIGVGGIDSAETAQQKIDAGAQLVQIYTGFIYKGPPLVKEIVKQITVGQ